ncbi:OTU domain-containing protein 6B [Seminavis robusta]|uniref:OTU domain-containing protein 6B n=1 Tax=Seminavis robusta TaxID=568900 RepID=A0A9N8EXX0_9STRA|nr:OTU domain-containing protein 6B [Seminavis robusta]|eukprot:Sro2332_g323620.1 OTU domain-containing protein 6B (287) ;mRNA; f:5413-6473
MTLEETQARHRKELKALDGEKRSALKKAKGTAGKGKKGKEKLAELEAEYDAKQKALEEKHAKEIAELSGSGDSKDTPAPAPEPLVEKTAEEEERERKQAKARRKREKAKEKERDRELEIERENAEAGPSLRKIELERIEQQLTPLGLKIEEIASDGNCLYRAVAAHCGNSYQETRTLCADSLAKNEAEFAPFCEYDDDKTQDFTQYVERVRNSADWGGHLELRALSLALQKQIVVYRAQSNEPLRIKPEESAGDDDENAIRLSYHLNYYALGEHYNRVVKASATTS